MAFSIFTDTCSYHTTTAALQRFYHPPEKPHNQSSHSPAPSTSRQPPVCFQSVWICLYWTFDIDGIIQYEVFCDWLFSHSTFSSFSQVITLVFSFFLLLNCILLYGYTSFIYQSVWFLYLFFSYSWFSIYGPILGE